MIHMNIMVCFLTGLSVARLDLYIYMIHMNIMVCFLTGLSVARLVYIYMIHMIHMIHTYDTHTYDMYMYMKVNDNSYESQSHDIILYTMITTSCTYALFIMLS